MLFWLRLSSVALLLAACAPGAEQSGQRIAITTNPPGAACSVARVGAPLASIANTPGSILVGPGRADLLVTCAKPGYQTITLSQPAHPLRPRTGNVVISRGVGALLDTATGGYDVYPGEIALDLQPRNAGGNAAPY